MYKKVIFALFLAGMFLTMGRLSHAQTLEMSTWQVDFAVADTSNAMLNEVIYVKNTGSQDLILDSLGTLPHPFSVDTAMATPGSIISGGDSLAVSLYASRSGNPGLYQSLLNIYSNDIDTSVALTLQLSWGQSAFTADDVLSWTGSGSKHAVLVISFNDGSSPMSYAWGYRFDGNKTAEDMLSAIHQADTSLEIDMPGGMISDISYLSHSGISGSPNFWGTWSSTGVHNWAMNMGVSTELADSAWFGCSYTDFMPALIPHLPVAAQPTTTSITSTPKPEIKIYPNPFRQNIHVQIPSELQNSKVQVINMKGQQVWYKNINTDEKVDLSHLEPGLYFLRIANNKHHSVVKIQKQ